MRRPSKLLNFSDGDACGIGYEEDYYTAAKTLMFDPLYIELITSFVIFTFYG